MIVRTRLRAETLGRLDKRTAEEQFVTPVQKLLPVFADNLVHADEKTCVEESLGYRQQRACDGDSFPRRAHILKGGVLRKHVDGADGHEEPTDHGDERIPNQFAHGGPHCPGHLQVAELPHHHHNLHNANKNGKPYPKEEGGDAPEQFSPFGRVASIGHKAPRCLIVVIRISVGAERQDRQYNWPSPTEYVNGDHAGKNFTSLYHNKKDLVQDYCCPKHCG